jgi:hypothetical protein
MGARSGGSQGIWGALGGGCFAGSCWSDQGKRGNRQGGARFLSTGCSGSEIAWHFIRSFPPMRASTSALLAQVSTDTIAAMLGVSFASTA